MSHLIDLDVAFYIHLIRQFDLAHVKCDVAFITEFIQTKGETRIEIAEILPAELNEQIGRASCRERV